MKFFLFFFLIINTVSAGQLINEFNFSASTDGLYKLKDGRVFEASSLDGHLKNNIGSYGKIKCNSLIDTIYYSDKYPYETDGIIFTSKDLGVTQEHSKDSIKNNT